MRLLMFFVILVTTQCIHCWDRPYVNKTSLWNYVTNRTSRFYHYVREKVVTVKTYIVKGKEVVLNRTEDGIVTLSNELKRHIITAKATVGTVYESILSRKKSNCSDNYIGNHMATPELIALNNYTAESHTVTTEDGYIITLHRIPFSKNNNYGTYKTVLLHHGLLASSADWIMTGHEKGLAYILSDAGYDVWMANARGNIYSRAHVSRKVNSFEFWNFTFHEIGYYDLPAVIDYIIDKKGRVDINYIGFSMGTTVLFTLLSTRPEYNKVLKAGYAMAPIAYMSEVNGPLHVLADYGNNIKRFMELFGANEFLPRNMVIRFLAKHSCTMSTFEETLCKMSMYMLCGHDKEFDISLKPMIYGHVPAGASTKTLAHFAQIMKNDGRFQYFDYGQEKNLEFYGTEIPPAYAIDKITLPITLLSGEDDWLSSITDAKKLYSELPNPREHFIIKDFNHLDFLFAKDAPTVLYKKLLDLLEDSENEDQKRNVVEM